MSEEEKQLALFLEAALKDSELENRLLSCNHPDIAVEIAKQIGFTFTAEAVLGELSEYQGRGPWSPLGLRLDAFHNKWDANGFYKNYREEGMLCIRLINDCCRVGKIPTALLDAEDYASISTLLGENGHRFSEHCVSRVLRHPLLFL